MELESSAVNRPLTVIGVTAAKSVVYLSLRKPKIKIIAKVQMFTTDSA